MADGVSLLIRPLISKQIAGTNWYIYFLVDDNKSLTENLSKQKKLNYRESIIFDLDFESLGYAHHCVRGLQFFSSD